MFHGKIRSHDRGLLPQGDRGGQFALRPGDPRHRRHRAVRQHARPLHQERPGFRRRVQSYQPPNLPGHKDDEGADHPREGHRTGSDPPRREQGRPRAPEGGEHRGGQLVGPAVGLPVHRGVREEPDQRQRGVCGDRARDELQPRKGEEKLLLLHGALIMLNLCRLVNTVDSFFI